jgi:hypothetical protein
MTEPEWLDCTDPMLILEYLPESATDRKLRLFAVACCRRIWHLLREAGSREAVAIAEQDAEGFIGRNEKEQASQDAAHAFILQGAASDVVDPQLQSALGWFYDQAEATRYLEIYRAAYQTALANRPPDEAAINAAAYAAFAAHSAVSLPANLAAEFACGHAAIAMGFDTHPATDPGSGDPAELTEQCRLLRDIFCNPFRSAAVDPSWLTPKVNRLTQTIYDDQVFDRMLELANALEEGGCTNKEILQHCRQQGVHVRGCWVVDLLLGKK